MSVPRPDHLDAFLDDVIHDVEQVRELYRWLQPSAFERPRRGASERTAGGGEHDLSDEVVATERVRVLIRHAVREVMDGRNRLAGAKADLNDAQVRLDPEPTVDRHERSLPHPADRGDLERARANQQKRLDRAEGKPIDRGTARVWRDGEPVEEPLRPGRAAGGWDEVTG